MRALSSVVLALPLLATLARSDVHVVDSSGGPGVDFTSVQAAADAAAEGDTLLVRGSHAGLDVSAKSLNVVADSDGSFTLQRMRVEDLSSGQWFAVRGADVGLAFSGLQPLQLTDIAGSVLFEDCSFSAPLVTTNTQLNAAVLSNVADATFVCCVLVGGSAPFAAFNALDGTHGLLATGSSVHLFECIGFGGAGGECGSTGSCFGGHGGRAVQVAGGFLLAYGTALTGGDGGDASGVCIAGGAHGGDGGHAIRSVGAAVHLVDSQLGGGPGGLAFNSDFFCQPDHGLDGLPLSGPPAALHSVQARSFSASSPHRPGESVAVAVGGLPGDLVFMVLAADQAPQFLAPFHATLVPRIVGILPLGVVPSSGRLQLAFPLGPLGSGVEALLLYGQPGFLPLADTFILGPPTAVTLLDSPF